MEISGESHHSFFVWLPSNTENGAYKNRTNDFLIEFPRPLRLEGTWDVALVEIYFPFNWYTLKNDSTIDFCLEDTYAAPLDRTQYAEQKTILSQDNLMSRAFMHVLKKSKKLVARISSAKVPAGVYQSVQSILDVIQEGVKGVELLETNLKLQYDEKTQKTSINSKVIGCFYFSVNEYELAHCLGIGEYNQKPGPFPELYDLPYTTPEGASAMLLFQEPALYIYTDFIDYSIAGNCEVPILRTVPVTGKEGTTQYVSFGDNKIWVRLNRGYINAVHVQILDSRGEKVKFKSGKALLVLQFKRVSPV